MINFVKNNWKGIVLSLFVAVPSWFLGGIFPIIGGPVIGIVLGIIIGLFLKKDAFASGIAFTSKKILQLAVVLLGFGLNLNVVLQTGKQSLPIILATISVSLIIAFVMGKVFRVPAKIATLVGVGSSICGGSAIAATAPVIQADDNEVASSISVIFLFNVLAAILFPILGKLIGFSTECGEAFGIFAGTAINDTSSVTAAASTWDSLYNLGSMTLDKAVTVKLTRTLAIIPITLTLAFIQAKKENNKTSAFSFRRAFPMFIPYFVLASLITTVALYFGADASIFKPFKILSKFFIVLAMSAIGLNTNIIALVKNGGKALLLGFCCWTGITAVSLLLQHIMKIW